MNRSDCESTRRFLTDRRDAPILVRIKTARSTRFTPSTITPPPTWSHAMRRLPICLLGALLLNLLVAYQLNAQEKSDGSTTSSRTFRPVVRGTQYAVSSMKQEATRLCRKTRFASRFPLEIGSPEPGSGGFPTKPSPQPSVIRG